MTSQQYEELCRYFMADQLQLSLDAVQSLWVPNPERDAESWHTNLGPYAHQIDLYWETWSFLTRYLNIANAKWHEAAKVGMQHVLLLQQVRTKVGAHKAFLITNTGFSQRAQHAAADEGIGLLIVRPEFDTQKLGACRRDSTQECFRELAHAKASIYSCQVVQKGLRGSLSPAALLGLPQSPVQDMPCGRRAAVMAPPISSSQAGGSFGGAGGPGGYSTRQGPGAGYRTK